MTSTYKKASDKINDKINTEAKRIMENKTVLNRMFINGKNNCFITLNDHKENILNNPKTRLLNPATNQLGRISKAILDKINLNLRNTTKANQWKNTNDVSLIGLKASKTSKIVSLFHLILKIFTLQLLRNCYQNA